jgi:hypothetical protein
MLKSIMGTELTVVCDRCQNVFTDDCTGIIVRYNEEFGEYENYYVKCPQCGSIEFYNMNIPIDDTDEPFMTGDLPVNEEVQRYYVRLLIRTVREDFVNAK